MGNRASAFISEGTNKGRRHGVYLYTHWQGDKLPLIVQKALSREERWGDSSYLARIIFCEMIKFEGGDFNDSLGFGISQKPVGVEHPVIELVPARSRVFLVSDDRSGSPQPITDPCILASWSFTKYIKLDFTGEQKPEGFEKY